MILKKMIYSAALILFWVTSLNATPARAQETPPPAESDSGAVVCAPGVYAPDPGECLPLGPSQTLKEMSGLGIPYPLTALPTMRPADTLNYVPYQYFKITEPFTHTYPSLEAAIDKTSAIRQLGPGNLLYVSYNRVEDTGHGVYFLLPSGEWMPGAGTRVSVPIFQGFEFYATPRNAFGWVLDQAKVRSQPDYGDEMLVTGSLPRYSVVQVYTSMTIENTEWLLIGPNQWLEGRQVGVVWPHTTPPAVISGDRWIDVNLAEQTLAVYDKNQMVFATLIASGLDPFFTRPGVFQIYQKKESEHMTGAFEADRSDYYDLENVPYTLYFDKARAIHGAYWRALFGYPQSHGCVNMSVGDSAWIFQWAHEGDWVYVHDPSGATPSDPAFYGDGGA